MKINKYRRHEQNMKQVYEKYFGFRQPYQLLVDAAMCTASLRHKFDLKERLGLLLGGPVKLMVSSCVMDTLRAIAKAAPEDAIATGAPFVARRLELRRCHHSPAVSVCDCFTQLLGEANINRYGIVTSEDPIKEAARKIPGVPLIYLERTFPLLEAPTKSTLKRTEQLEEEKLHVSKREIAVIKRSLGEEIEPETEKSEPQHKRRKAKGPNPLSMKKKTSIYAKQLEEQRPKRKRKKKINANTDA